MIDWREIDTVLLDMDGTLLDLHFDSHFWLEHLPRRYVELHQLDQASQDALKTRIMGEQGTLNWYSLAYWSRELDVDIVALKREVQHLIGLRSDAHDFLTWLKQSHPPGRIGDQRRPRKLSVETPPHGVGKLPGRHHLIGRRGGSQRGAGVLVGSARTGAVRSCSYALHR